MSTSYSYLESLAVLDVLISDIELGKVQLLGGQGDVNWIDEHFGNSMLHVLVYRNLFDQVKLLISVGADVNIRNTNGEVPLHWAARGNSLRCTMALIEAGADVNAVDNSNSTPLHYAAVSGNPEVVPIMLQAGCDISVIDCDGKTALQVARQAIQRTKADNQNSRSRSIIHGFEGVLAMLKRHQAQQTIQPHSDNAISAVGKNTEEDDEDDERQVEEGGRPQSSFGRKTDRGRSPNRSTNKPNNTDDHWDPSEVESSPSPSRQALVIRSSRSQSRSPLKQGAMTASTSRNSPTGGTTSALLNSSIAPSVGRIRRRDIAARAQPFFSVRKIQYPIVAEYDPMFYKHSPASSPSTSKRKRPKSASNSLFLAGRIGGTNNSGDNSHHHRRLSFDYTMKARRGMAALGITGTMNNNSNASSSPEKRAQTTASWSLTGESTVAAKFALSSSQNSEQHVYWKQTSLVGGRDGGNANAVISNLNQEVAGDSSGALFVSLTAKVTDILRSKSTTRGTVPALAATPELAGLTLTQQQVRSTSSTTKAYSSSSAAAAVAVAVAANPTGGSGATTATTTTLKPSGKSSLSDDNDAERRWKMKVPIMPKSTALRGVLDCFVIVEQCWGCSSHQGSLRHDESKYTAHADACLRAATAVVLESRAPVKLYAYKQRASDISRLGALEVYIAIRATHKKSEFKLLPLPAMISKEVSIGDDDQDPDDIIGRVVRSKLDGNDDDEQFDVLKDVLETPRERTRATEQSLLSDSEWIVHPIFSKIKTKSWPTNTVIREATTVFLDAVLDHAELPDSFWSKARKLKRLLPATTTGTTPGGAPYSNPSQQSVTSRVSREASYSAPIDATAAAAAAAAAYNRSAQNNIGKLSSSVSSSAVARLNLSEVQQQRVSAGGRSLSVDGAEYIRDAQLATVRANEAIIETALKKEMSKWQERAKLTRFEDMPITFQKDENRILLDKRFEDLSQRNAVKNAVRSMVDSAARRFSVRSHSGAVTKAAIAAAASGRRDGRASLVPVHIAEGSDKNSTELGYEGSYFLGYPRIDAPAMSALEKSARAQTTLAKQSEWEKRLEKWKVERDERIRIFESGILRQFLVYDATPGNVGLLTGLVVVRPSRDYLSPPLTPQSLYAGSMKTSRTKTESWDNSARAPLTSRMTPATAAGSVATTRRSSRVKGGGADDQQASDSALRQSITASLENDH